MDLKGLKRKMCSINGLTHWQSGAFMIQVFPLRPQLWTMLASKIKAFVWSVSSLGRHFLSKRQHRRNPMETALGPFLLFRHEMELREVEWLASGCSASRRGMQMRTQKAERRTWASASLGYTPDLVSIHKQTNLNKLDNKKVLLVKI